jgi:hypothetical protein
LVVKHRIAVALSCCAFVACGSAGDGGTPAKGGACPLSPAARQLLTGLIVGVEEEISTAIGSQSQLNDPAFAWSFVGIDSFSGADEHLAMPCSAPSGSSGETCNALPSIPGVSTCFRNRCEAANVLFVDSYAVNVDRTQTAFSYVVSAPYPPGMVTYDSNPPTSWRYDYTQPGVIGVSAPLQRNIATALASGESLNLSVTGQTSDTQTAAGTTEATALSLAQLSPAGAIQVTMQYAIGAHLSGRIALGDRTLATLDVAGPATPAALETSFVWQDQCAQ